MSTSIAQSVAELLDLSPLGDALTETEFCDLVDDVVADLVARFERVTAPLAEVV